MSKEKLLFFDIDGTLWDYYNNIPQSAVEGIHAAQAAGHLCFINSGRTRAFITDENLLGIGFDGIVSGCGTMIEIGGERRLYHRMDTDTIIRALDIFGKHSFMPIFEGPEYLYIDHETFTEDKFLGKLEAEMGPGLVEINDYWGRWEASKFSCAVTAGFIDGARPDLEDDFEFLVHSPTVVELVPRGFSKGTGIEKVCEILGRSAEDTIAFGDSANDLPMLKTAGVAVVMGNGSEEAKAAADHITADLEEDGIAKALQHLHLI